MNQQKSSFLEYLEYGKLADKIEQAILFWCQGNYSFVKEKVIGTNVYWIDNIEDGDLELNYYSVWIDHKRDLIVNFDIHIGVDVDVAGRYNNRKYGVERFTSRFTLTLFCNASLNNKLEDFKILSIDEYSKSKPNKPLSGDFVPYIKKQRYDYYANEILEKYYLKIILKQKLKPDQSMSTSLLKIWD